MDILGKEGLCNLGFDIPVDGEVTFQQAIMLNRVEEELPSASDVAKADNIELEEITRNAAKHGRLNCAIQNSFTGNVTHA